MVREEGRHDQLMGDSDGEYFNLIKTFHDSEEKKKEHESDGINSVAGMISLPVS